MKYIIKIQEIGVKTAGVRKAAPKGGESRCRTENRMGKSDAKRMGNIWYNSDAAQWDFTKQYHSPTSHADSLITLQTNFRPMKKNAKNQVILSWVKCHPEGWVSCLRMFLTTRISTDSKQSIGDYCKGSEPKRTLLWEKWYSMDETKKEKGKCMKTLEKSHDSRPLLVGTILWSKKKYINRGSWCKQHHHRQSITRKKGWEIQIKIPKKVHLPFQGVYKANVCKNNIFPF